jgi:fermentation-respiration switch protein FrsA (DUF1100 family)
VTRRLGWLLLALALAAPALARAPDVWVATAFLIEFLSEGRWRPLSRASSPPAVRPLLAPVGADSLAADLHVVPGLPRPPGLVLVHGLTEAGREDPRLREAARLLAAAGWAVAVQTVTGLTRMRLRPEDARPPELSAIALAQEGYRPVALLGVSLGAGPAVSATAAMTGAGSAAPRLSAVLLLGGYASTRELLRFTLTGHYRLGPLSGIRPVHEEAIALFAQANTELLDRPGAALAANRDPSRVDALLDDLRPSTRELLDTLSPERYLPQLRAPLFLVHGRADPVVPFTESLRLEQAARSAGLPVRLVLLGTVEHVESGRATALREMWQMWALFYAFRVTARSG